MKRVAAPLAALLVLAAPAAIGQTLHVGPAKPFATIGAALDAALPGDTVLVGPGVYRERLVVARPVVLLGEGWPVVDGGGRGHVLEARAALTLRGVVLRGSGRDVVHEDAGVYVEGAPVRIEGNRIEDVLYGISLKSAAGSVVIGNRIAGMSLPLPRRGDGIRLWESDDTRIERNVVVGARDVVVFFSDRLVVRGNRIEGGRYALHTMSSHELRIEGNIFVDNEVGAYLMFSRGVVLRGNVLARAKGATGIGLGLKDADRVVAADNLIAQNRVGVWIDNSPAFGDGEAEWTRANRFERNALVDNGVAVRMLPAVRGNRFEGNELIANRRAVEVAGGAAAAQAERNRWRGNHWEAYAGFDRDRDGAGDTPHVEARLSEAIVGRWPALTLFAGSPALAALDHAARIVPLLEPEPVAVDPAPRLESHALAAWETELRALSSPTPAHPRMAALGWLVFVAAAGFALRRAAEGAA